MRRVLKTGAVIVIVPLLLCCGLALKCWLAVVKLVYGLMGWELAWPPVERVEDEPAGQVRPCRSRLG